MGYTHYFTIKRRPTDRQWAAFVRDVRAILAHPAVAPRVCFERDQPDRPPQVDEEAVQFNGRGGRGARDALHPARRAPQLLQDRRTGPDGVRRRLVGQGV